ncbi:dienelactone hydrolase family protein [Streptomyces sp. NPDC055400]
MTSGKRVRPRATADGDERLAELYAKVQGTVATIPAMYQALANSPAILDGWIGLGWSLRADAAADRGLCELAILRVAQLTRCDYVWRSHWHQARRAGIGEDKIGMLGEWPDSALYSPLERAVLALADELTQNATVAEATWGPVADLVDDRQAVELVMTIAWYCCVARVAAGLAVPLDDHHARVPGLPGSDRGADNAPACGRRGRDGEQAGGGATAPDGMQQGTQAKPGVQVEAVSLLVGDAEVRTWLYRPKPMPAEPLPALVMGAEATGVNRFIHDTAAALAALGLVVAVPDYYRGEGQADPDDYTDIAEIMRHVDGLDFQRATYDLMAALDHLKADPTVDPRRIGVWGYCTGGTLAWLTACLRRDVAAAILFYPSQPVFNELTDRRPAHPIDLLWNLNCPVFLVYGEKDPLMPPDRLESVRERFGRWGVEHTIHVAPGCDHSFGAPIPGRHDAAAYERAWAEAVAFVSSRLGRRAPDG